MCHAIRTAVSNETNFNRNVYFHDYAECAYKY